MPADSLRDMAVPLRTLDPADPDLSDLDVLRDVVGDARVVCLGESAHFTSEFAQLRDRMLRFLVSKLGFSAFVLESGLPESLAVDRWVHGGTGRLADIARTGIGYAFGRCTEMHTQLQWMREWNDAHASHPVSYYGMDVPGWCANPGPGVATCLARLTPQPGDAELLAATERGQLGRAPSVDASDTAGVAPGVARGVAELVDRATAAGDPLAVQCARGAEAVVEFLDHGMYPGPGRNLRNEVMADNLRWILDHEDRVLVSAHNMHLQYTPSWDGTEPIGSLLASELGNDLVVIGGTHAGGSIPDLDLDAAADRRYFTWDTDEPAPPASHTLEASLDTAGYAHHLVHLRHTPAGALTGVTATQAQTPQKTMLLERAPQHTFDAVIHVHRITPANGAPDHVDTTTAP